MSELIAFFAGWFAMMFLWYMTDYKVVFAAYHKGKADATPKWIPCSDCERRCKKWEHSKTLQE